MFNKNGNLIITRRFISKSTKSIYYFRKLCSKANKSKKIKVEKRKKEIFR